jgi:hypothetical protein
MFLKLIFFLFLLLEQGTLDEVVKQSLIDDRFYNNNSFKVT